MKVNLFRRHPMNGTFGLGQLAKYRQTPDFCP
jgi:hypothetical protein